MGLVDRIQASRSEQRVIGGVPWRLRPWDSPFASFSSGGPIHPSRATYGTDEALRLVPVYACVRMIAEYIASLPLKMYIKTDSGHQKRWNGPSIFDDPAPSVNVMDWLYECLTSLLLHGNAWGYILGRDGYGYPTQIAWMPPERVTVIDDETQPFNPLRSRVYFYGRLMNREEYFHIKAFSLPGRTEGISPLRAFALTILNGLEVTRYGTDWFKAGGFPPGTFKNCADAETEILTRDGWRRYDELKPGDETLTLNTATGMSEWQPIKTIYVNDGPNDVVKMRNATHSSVTTPNHRWPVMISGRYKIRKDGSRWRDPPRYRWYTTETLPRDARICAAAVVTAPAETKWSDAMAELTAWFFTEGHIGPYGGVVIGQSDSVNPSCVTRIRTSLTEVFGAPAAGDMQRNRAIPQWQERCYPAEYRGAPYSMATFHLNAAAGRVLTNVAPEKVVSTRFLSELTRAQLELFISTAIDGDGTLCRAKGSVTPYLAQTDERRLEAFQVACALAGKSGNINGPHPSSGQYGMAVQSTPWRKPAGHPEYVTAETIDGPVWCPSTPNKTWFARRDGTCYFTGNTEIEIDSAQSAEIRGLLNQSIRRREPLVYGRDWDYHPISVPPSEAQFIEATQMNATQLAAVYGLPPDRVGGKRGDSLTYSCADAATEILTRRGWLRHDQVTDSDTCLGLNLETGLAEWQSVQSVHVYDDGPFDVIKMENGTHSSVTTGNHRWPVMIFGRPDYRDGWRWKTTETMPRDARVCAAAPVTAPVEPKWSDSLVELVAWTWTEGWVGKSGAVTITQSATANPRNVVCIRAALTELFGPDAKLAGRSLLGSKGRENRSLIRDELERDPDRSNREIARICNADGHTVARVRAGKIDSLGWTEDVDDRGISHFRLNSDAGRVLLEHAPGKVVATAFLADLTRTQLELFYQVSIDADGTRRPDGRGAVMAQKDLGRLEAFQVACALTGRSGVIRQNASGMWSMSVQVTPWRKPKDRTEYVTRETTDLVWCVQTPTLNWFARRNGTCYFTGNTVQQGALQIIEALRPWLVRLETAFFTILPQNRLVRFNSDALLKTDLQERAQIYKTWRDIGFKSVDEMRDTEDLEPLPNNIGTDNIPLDAIIAMSRSTRAIPNTLLPQVTLEQRLLYEYLQSLAAGNEPSGLPPGAGGPVGAGAGNAPLAVDIPGALGANTTTTGAPGANGTAGGGFKPPNVLQQIVKDMLSVRSNGDAESSMEQVLAAMVKKYVRQAQQEDEQGPEFVGPWIPPSKNGHNGHG